LKPDRRKQIIDSAFALLAENKSWSLSGLATSIGVSKTALYRHFASKAEIENAMDEELYGEIKKQMESLSTNVSNPVDRRNMRWTITMFLRAHQGYLFLLMNHFFSDDDFAASLFKRLTRESPASTCFAELIEKMTAEEQKRMLIAILKNWISILLASFRIEGLDANQDQLLDVLENGIQRLVVPDQKRIRELEELSNIEISELRESNRLFNAIAASIHQHGVQDTTIETIAGKMGTAKSSLYFYGKNKDAMLKDLIKSETETILELCAKRADSGKTLAEQLYILMMVHANYLILKPDFIPVFNWIRYETIKRKVVPHDDRPDMERLLESYRIEELYSDGYDGTDKMMYAEMTISWASVLSTSCIIFGMKQGLDNETLRKNIYIMFESMMKGDN